MMFNFRRYTVIFAGGAMLIVASFSAPSTRPNAEMNVGINTAELDQQIQPNLPLFEDDFEMHIGVLDVLRH